MYFIYYFTFIYSFMLTIGIKHVNIYDLPHKLFVSAQVRILSYFVPKGLICLNHNYVVS